MVPVTTCGMRFDSSSYFYEWHEVRWLQLLISVASGWMGTITTEGYGVTVITTKWHHVRWLQLLLRVVSGLVITVITMSGIRFDGYNYYYG